MFFQEPFSLIAVLKTKAGAKIKHIFETTKFLVTFFFKNF